MEQKETNPNNYYDFYWTKAIEAIIIAIAVLVPIVFYPHCNTVFLPAKELLAEILIILGLMCWAFLVIDRGKIEFNSAPLNLPTSIFMAISIFSLIWSNNFIVSLKELPLFLAGPLLYFLVTNNIHNKQQVNRILNILVLVGSLFGIYGILQYNGIDLPIWIRNVGRQQVFGLFGNVNFFAEYLIIPLPISVSLFFASKNKVKKTLLFIGILAMGLTLTFTFTRGSYLAFGFSLVFMFILHIYFVSKSFFKENKKIFTIILVIVILIASLFIISTPLSKTGTVISKIKSRISVSQFTSSYSLKRRIATWKSTILMIKDNPFLGSGIGTYKYNSLKYQAKFFEQGQNRSLYPQGMPLRAHNEYLQLWAEMGIIGLSAFLLLLISYFNYGLRFLKKTKNRYKQGILIGLMGAIVAVSIDSIFGFPLHLPATIVLFWLTLALTVSIIRDETGSEKKYFVKKDKNKKIKEEKDSTASLIKFFLSLVIVLGTIFLCVTLVRPFIARTYWYYGDKELKSKNVNQAIKMYENALKWDPYLGEVYYEMGRVLESRGIYNLALENYEKAEKYVDHPDLPKDMADVYLRKKLYDKAAIKLRKAISYQEKEESMVTLLNQLGGIYYYQKKYEYAEIAYKKALKIDSEFLKSYNNLAKLYSKQNKEEKALEMLGKIIEIAPDSKEASSAKISIQKFREDTEDTEKEDLKEKNQDTNN